MTKWLLFVCATLMLAACSADSNVLGPEAGAAPVGAVAAPSVAKIQATAVQSGGGVHKPRRGRYAMAAN